MATRTLKLSAFLGEGYQEATWVGVRDAAGLGAPIVHDVRPVVGETVKYGGRWWRVARVNLARDLIMLED